MNRRQYGTMTNVSKLKRHMARVLAFIMCLILLVTSVDITAFAVTGDYSGNGVIQTAEYTDEVPGQNESAGEDIISDENEEKTPVVEETGDDSDTSEDIGEGCDTSEEIEEVAEGESEKTGEEEPEEVSDEKEANVKEDKAENSMELEETVTVDDVIITVSADAGVFPNGSKVSVRKASRSEEKEVNDAIDEVRDDKKNVALSYTFDISVCDEDGNEIEPNTEKGSVKVSFKMAEIANENLETDVYHVEETAKGLNAENLEVDTENSRNKESDEITVETDGFSYYTVEFTYGELQYVLEGDDRVELSTVLKAVGIEENGEISKVEGSDDELFKPVKEDDVWYIEAVKAFSSEEWLKVTIDGIEYEIVVTDNQGPGEWSKLLNALSGTSTSIEGQFDISVDEEGTTIKLLTDFTADSATTLTVNGNKILDLNGHVITANEYIISVITVNSGATLTLKDSDSSKAQYYTYNKTSPWTYIGDTYDGDAIDYENMSNATLNSGSTVINLPGGAITGGNRNNDRGSALWVNGTLVMNAGNVVGNKTYGNGGGLIGGTIYLNGSEFTMNGGNICGNATNNCGGGVDAKNGGKFYFKDGIISNNYAPYSNGSAVQIDGTNCVFNMSGGSITQNHTGYSTIGTYWGSAVLCYNGQFIMTGGEISGNTSENTNDCAVAINSTVTATIGGSAKIIDNTIDGHAANLCLYQNETIEIGTEEAVPTTMLVGVTLRNGTGKVTNTGAGKYAKYFSSDNGNYQAYAKNNEVFIGNDKVLNINTNNRYDTISNAISAAEADDTIRLLDDITENVTVGKSIIIDLNGNVIKGSGTSSTITVSNNATLTLRDSGTNAVHYFKYRSAGPWVWDDSSTSGAITVDEITDDTAADTPIIIKGGAITGGSGSYNSIGTEGGGIYNAGTLMMEGGNIVGNSAGWHGGGIHSKGSFELKDGNIVGNYSGTHGAGVFIDGTSSKFVMNGGRIINNYANAQAGGVYLANGSFDLNKGIISYNRAYTFAGGVSASGIMKMYGGEISYNKTTRTDTFGYGGGIHNQNELYIYGGYIGNNSACYGGGIYNGYIDSGYNNPGYLTMTGGTVAENNCSIAGGGAYFRNGGITLGGTADISGNKKGSGQDASEQNVYLPSGDTVAIADGGDAPKEGMKIGVSMAAGTGYFTTATATEDCEDYFFADESEKSDVFDPSKEQMLIVNGKPQVHDGVVFVEWKEKNSLPAMAGNYYLTEDVTLSSQWQVPAGTTNLCLNGHVIKQGTFGYRVIYVPTTATLNIYDCSSEKLYFTRNSESDPWVLATDQETPTNLFVEGGVITGGLITGVDSGAGIYVDGTFSMYGGNIAGNSITNSTADKVFGAAVFVQKTGVFNMYGGSIAGNACNANAGGVAVGANGNPTGKFNMYGGTISDNYAGLWGGGVNNWGTIVMKGGTITNNIAKTYGGGGVSNAATFTMTGGSIKNNNAYTAGGGVVGDGTVTIGGTAVITDNCIKESADNLSLGGSMSFASGEDAPTTGMDVGVTTRAASVPAAISVASDTDYSEYFSSDNSAYSIYYKSDKKLYLALPATVTIDLKGGSYPEGSSAVADWTYDSEKKTYSKKGNKVTLPGEPIPPAYMVFKGWKYNSNLYEAGTEIVFENTENRTYTAEYENIGSSIKTFATVADLKDPNCFTLYTGRGSGCAQKVIFGAKDWYIAGADADGSLVLMSALENFENSIFGTASTYSTSTIRNYLNTTVLPLFTEAEQDMMQNTVCSYVPAEGDKLYLANGVYDTSNFHTWITVGAGNSIAIGLAPTNSPVGSPYAVRSEKEGGNWFWLRVPHDAGDGKAYALIALPGLRKDGIGGVHFWNTNNSDGVVPAMNLNLSSVLFASAAPVASEATEFADGLNFRIDAGEKIGSTVSYTKSKISVTKGTDVGDLYLYVQGKDSTDDWVWSTKVSKNSSYDVSKIHEGADLSECLIWLETQNGDDRLAYAKNAGSTSPYVITLDAQGGTGSDESVEVTLYSDMPTIDIPEKDDEVFLGYYDEKKGGTKYYNSDGTSAKAWDLPSDTTLYAHWHTHSWTCFAGTGTDNHNTLYAVCSEPECDYYGSCEDTDNAVVVSVNKPSTRELIYDGEDFEATVTDADGKWENVFGFTPSIAYRYKEKSDDVYSTTSKIKDAGYYQASITVNNTTAYIEYLIAKADITPSVSIEGWTYGVMASTPEVTGNVGEGRETFKYKEISEEETAYSITVPTACGEYNIKAEIEETKNYNSGTATNTFTISKADRDSIELKMEGYKYGAEKAPIPAIEPAELDEKPSVTYKYRHRESEEEWTTWTGDTSSLDAGDYEMVAVIGATDSYNEYTSQKADFTVEKAEWKVTAPTAKNGLTYNCDSQDLINVGSVKNDGVMLYSLDFEGTYEANIPKGTKAGEYTVYYKVDADGNHKEYVPEAPLTVIVDKADWKVTAPEALNTTYSGEEITLINPGVVIDVDGSEVSDMMEYSLKENEAYSSDLPKSTDPGTYKVYYRVKGDENHYKYEAQFVTAGIIPTTGIWCADIPDQVYTGKAIKPEIKVYSDGTLLEAGKDYTITYKNNTKAAKSDATNAKGASIAPTVIITGKGNYATQKITRTFTIAQYNLSGEGCEEEAKVEPTTVAYTKKPIKLSPVVTLNGKKLKLGTDYVVSTTPDEAGVISSLTDVGKKTLYIVGKGNYTGAVEYLFTITDSVLASKVSIGKIANQTYTGEEIKPEISVTYNKADVTDDFVVDYQNNTEVGTATVTVTAKEGSGFSGRKSATFKITGANISSVKLGADGKGKLPSYTYSGAANEPEPELYVGTERLVKDKDYTLSYLKNINAGTATAVVTGKGLYTGSKKFSFKINKYDAGVVSDELIKVNNDEPIRVKYEKGGVMPKPVITMLVGGEEKELKEKTDYTLGYSNNKEVADVDAVNPKGKTVPPTITITFKGNLSGKKTVLFEIKQTDMDGVCIATAPDVASSTKAFAWKQTKITVTDVNGKKLAAGTDYDKSIRYYSDESCGEEYELTEATLPTDKYPNGKGWVYVKATAAETSKNYTGSVVGQYYISGINISSAKAVIADQKFTGSEIKLGDIAEEDINITIKVGKETRTLKLRKDGVEGKGYDCSVVPGSYTKNTDKGTASVTIRGEGEYFGTKVVKFKIVNKSFEWWED